MSRPLPDAFRVTLSDDAAMLLSEARAAAIAKLRAELTDAYAEALLDQLAEGHRPARRTQQPAAAPVEPPATERMRATGSPDGVWLYAVIRSDCKADLDAVTGVWGDAPVRCLDAGSLAVLVSDVCRDDVSRLAEATSASPGSDLIAAVRAHDAVIDTAFRAGPIVPLRFGTVVADDEAALRVLRSHGSTLTYELTRLSRAREWGVTLREIVHDQPVATDQPPAGGADYLRQRSSKRSEQARLMHDRHAAVSTARAQLSDLADETTYGPTHRDNGEQMLLNGSFLVNAAEEPAFLRACDELARTLSLQGVQLIRSGPWPPYHFVSVELEVQGA